MKVTKAQVKNMTLGELAARVPFATKLFQNYCLDFCCRGDQSLHDACSSKGLEVEPLIEELQTLMEGKDDIDWSTASNLDLTHIIIDQYHASLRATVPEILRLATKVELIHPEHPMCPTGLFNVLTNMWQELDLHMSKEENILFPMLTDLRQTKGAEGPIRQMISEHVDHGESLSKIRCLCGDFKLPNDACTTWKALYLGLSALQEELMEHIHLENNVLFQRALETKCNRLN